MQLPLLDSGTLLTLILTLLGLIGGNVYLRGDVAKRVAKGQETLATAQAGLIDTLGKDMEERDSQHTRDVSDLRAHIALLTAQIGAVVAERDTLARERDALAAERITLHARIAENEAKMLDQQGQIVALEGRVASLEAELAQERRKGGAGEAQGV